MKQYPPLEVARQEFTLVADKAALSNRNLYAIGGFNSEKGILDSIEKYDAQSKKWRIVKHMAKELEIQGLKAHQTIALPDCILIMGGYDGTKYSNSVWKFDTVTLSISSLPPMHIARASFKAVLSHNCHYIYAIGGFNDDSGPMSSVERFDLVSSTWSILSPMNVARYNHACHSCLTKL